MIGAFLLVFGGALMYYAPVLESGAFYKAEGAAFQVETGQNATEANINSAVSAAYNQALNIVNQAETISLVGLVIAPIGGGVLAYGLVAGKGEAKVSAPEPASPS